MTDLATEKQIAYIKDLGGVPNRGLTKREASFLIQELLAVRARNRHSGDLPADDISRLGCLIRVLIVAVVQTGLYYIYGPNISFRHNRSAIDDSVEYRDITRVIVTGGGRCYHLSTDCMSLQQPYTQIYYVPLTNAESAGYTMCEICTRNCSFPFYRIAYLSNDYSLSAYHMTDLNSAIPQSHNIRGPGNGDEFTPTSYMYGLLRAGFNVECDADWNIVDVWGPDGVHYDKSGEMANRCDARASAWMWIDNRNQK